MFYWFSFYPIDFSFLVFVDSPSSPRLLNAVCWYAVEFSFWQLLLFIYIHSLKWSHFYFHDFKYELYVHDSQICISNQEMSPELYTHLSHCQTDSFTWISTRYTKVNISQTKREKKWLQLIQTVTQNFFAVLSSSVFFNCTSNFEVWSWQRENFLC